MYVHSSHVSQFNPAEFKQASCLWSDSATNQVHPSLILFHVFWGGDSTPSQEGTRSASLPEHLVPPHGLFMSLLSLPSFGSLRHCCGPLLSNLCPATPTGGAVSWCVRSDLCYYSLTCCLPDWPSAERSPNHTRYKSSPKGGLGVSPSWLLMWLQWWMAASVTRPVTNNSKRNYTQVVQMLRLTQVMHLGLKP